MSNLYPDMLNPREKTALYSGFVPGIDLRKEMDILMKEYGHYILLCHVFSNFFSVHFPSPQSSQTIP